MRKTISTSAWFLFVLTVVLSTARTVAGQEKPAELRRWEIGADVGGAVFPDVGVTHRLVAGAVRYYPRPRAALESRFQYVWAPWTCRSVTDRGPGDEAANLARCREEITSDEHYTFSVDAILHLTDNVRRLVPYLSAGITVEHVRLTIAESRYLAPSGRRFPYWLPGAVLDGFDVSEERENYFSFGLGGGVRMRVGERFFVAPAMRYAGGTFDFTLSLRFGL